MTTTAIVSLLAKQAVFCSTVSIRRDLQGRYRKHKFDNHVYVDYADIIHPIRELLLTGDEGFLMPLLPASRIESDNPLRELGKGAGDIVRGISDARAPRTQYRLEGPRC
jgi:hypothetical protein